MAGSAVGAGKGRRSHPCVLSNALESHSSEVGFLTREEAILALHVSRRVASLVSRRWQIPWARDEVEGAAVEAAVVAMMRMSVIREAGAYLYRVCYRAATRTARLSRRPDPVRPLIPADDFEAVGFLVDLDRALQGTSPRTRKVVTLRLQGYSQRAVAQVVGLSQSGVQRRLTELRRMI